MGLGPGFDRASVRGLAPLVAAGALALEGVSCTCTGIGCWDDAEIRIQREGSPPRFAARLDVDGMKVECSAPPSSGKSGECQPNIVSLFATQDTLGVDFLGLAPRRIVITLLDGSTVVAERTFTPHYEKVQVNNGPLCDNPTCHHARETWTLP